MMKSLMRVLCLLLVLVSFCTVAGAAGVAVKKPSCGILRFTDATSCSEVDSDELMEGFVTDELLAEDLFSLVDISEDVSYPAEQAFWLNRDFIVDTGFTAGTKYLLTGKVLEVSSGAEADYAGTLLSNLLIGDSAVAADYVKVKAELRVINSRSGKEVWHGVETVKESDTAVRSKDIKLGDLSVDQEQYYKAVEECSKALVKALKKDVEKGKVYL
ncbi:MAG: hypothetical protein ACI3U2_02160 [Anaerovibrio sp.]